MGGEGDGELTKGGTMTTASTWSNGRIEIVTGENAVSCLARPKPVTALVAMWVFAALLLVVPGYFVVGAVRQSGAGRGVFNEVVLAIASSVMVVPAVLVLLVMIRRAGRRCGVEIAGNVVTLYTPDLAVPVHRFDLKDLKGATLAGRGESATLAIKRRKGLGIKVFIGYPSGALAAAMDAINRMVVHDRVHGFEVIPMAQIAPVRGEQPADGREGG